MFKRNTDRFSFLWIRHVLLVLCLLIVGVSVQAPIHGPVAHASSEPKVTVAVDATSASCEYVISARAARGRAIHRHCAPGTVIDTKVIPLSQAQAQHEVYVMPLPAHPSPQQFSQWMSQIHQLMLEKRRSLQHRIGHAPSCSDGGTTVWVDGGFRTVDHDYVNPEVQYHVNYNCSTIFLDTAQVVVGYVPYNNPVYWVEFIYGSSFRVTCHFIDLLYPNQTYSYNPDVTVPIGQDATFTFQYPGNDCPFGGGGYVDPINIGALT